MTREQKIVVTGAVSGLAAMLASLWLLFHLLPVPTNIANAGDSLAYALGWDALAALPLIGSAAITFAAARIAFWIGYRIDPLYRAAGFAGSAYLAGGLLVWACWLAVLG